MFTRYRESQGASVSSISMPASALFLPIAGQTPEKARAHRPVAPALETGIRRWKAMDKAPASHRVDSARSARHRGPIRVNVHLPHTCARLSQVSPSKGTSRCLRAELFPPSAATRYRHRTISCLPSRVNVAVTVSWSCSIATNLVASSTCPPPRAKNPRRASSTRHCGVRSGLAYGVAGVG